MKKTVLFLAFASMFSIACGDPCVDSCEASKECDGANELVKAFDCQALCDEAKKQAEDKGCTSEYDEAMSCGGDLDVCKPEDNADKCKAEGEAYGTCMAK